MFVIKQNDTSPPITAKLKNFKNRNVNLSGASVRFHMKTEYGNVIVNDEAIIIDNEKGVVRYKWKPGDTDTVGPCRAEFQVTYENGKIETFPNDSYIRVNIFAELA